MISTDNEAAATARFPADVAEHVMIVMKDDGLYRHLRFGKPGTGVYRFDIVTWPGYLCITGDMGCYTFSRIEDMFQFFSWTGSIDYRYWAEKAQNADDLRTWSPKNFRANVREEYRQELEYTDVSALPDLWQAIQDEVLSASEYEHEAMHAVTRFEHGGFRFQDAWEWECWEYTYRFVWVCQAIRWAIQQYRAAQAVME